MKNVKSNKQAPAGFRAFLGQIFADRKSANEDFENRYSVLYTLNDQYQHIGCPTQEHAQTVLGSMLTDENRVPVGIYDSKTDSFEWEIVGEYLAGTGTSAQNSRQERILTIARALRRRDASWNPAHLQRPGIFA